MSSGGVVSVSDKGLNTCWILSGAMHPFRRDDACSEDST